VERLRVRLVLLAPFVQVEAHQQLSVALARHQMQEPLLVCGTVQPFAQLERTSIHRQQILLVIVQIVLQIMPAQADLLHLYLAAHRVSM